jgi:murein DD-endopeptidase MepM/ murein hydrolase activator NlpD
MRTKATLLAVGVALAGSSVLGAPPAHAAAQDGHCDPGEFCLYFNSGQTGSMVDMTNGHKDYGSTPATCIKFITRGDGRDRCVKNNAASAWNREETAVTVFYKSNWAGAIDALVAGERANLTKTKNENAGHVIGDPANSRIVGALYDDVGGRITSYFDGYLSTAGRHEGIDIAKGIGVPVHALLRGHVTRVSAGARGRDGLSTIAIYNADLDRTIVYLHSDPVNSLGVGDSVSRGQRIGYEDWRGITYSSSAHTHVEMRTGRRESAADSTDDPVLDNPIPTEFWMNRGYNLCCT